ncbi:MAG: succinyl-diaminopimelate desuccinylase [Alphaproteobacteria bacterium]|nr:succinyl-diaminopimelate desuccinylase [Alphaproteobacteria bacterium]MDE2013321.1 succinyl-diaminopimelate desuccinylase [Alphaproteobacteria bacterium]MDE2072257.1 succinyl-diaminopimelate desuccinylase [Alphaproteobacteria bacterium]
MTNLDPIALSQALIRCRSVTPEDGGALAVLEAALVSIGFQCHRLRFEEEGSAPVENLYARYGHAGPNFCFAGHTDVVPPGDAAHWRHDPFAAVIENGMLYGRGASDMKSAVAAFAAAAARQIADGPFAGSISLLVTGDEEGVSINGTKKVLAWMAERGERIDHCLVGEPTSTASTGDAIKIGRRGSLNVRFTARGIQGHSAYPQRALNPVPILATLVSELAAEPLDAGSAHFEPTTLVFTTFDVGNPATNVSPAEARAACNIRFNDLWTAEKLITHLKAKAEAVTKRMGGQIETEYSVSGVSFLTAPGAFTDLLENAVKSVTGAAPEFSTGGGTSDARFIKDHAPVAELGLCGTTMHKVDECVPVAEIETLADIYAAILASYFSKPPK